MDYKLCFEQDEWLTQYREGNPIWIAKLNDEKYVYCDDGRYEGNIPGTWQRLKKYCEDTGLYVVQFRFGFRSNMFSMPSDKPGYFFARAARGYFGSNDTLQLWTIGYTDGADVQVSKWQVPEMFVIETEKREKHQCGESLIVKQNL